VVLLLALPACSSGTKADAGPTASVTAPSTTADPQAAVKADVEAAYLRSWDVYAKALRSTDVSLLAGTYAAVALENLQREIVRLRDAAQAVEVRVEHGPLSVSLVDSSARVEERYRNHSVLVDAGNGRRVEEDPDDDLSIRSTLERRDGRWVVTYVESL
jgi:hypothetical protein